MRSLEAQRSQNKGEVWEPWMTFLWMGVLFGAWGSVCWSGVLMDARAFCWCMWQRL